METLLKIEAGQENETIRERVSNVARPTDRVRSASALRMSKSNALQCFYILLSKPHYRTERAVWSGATDEWTSLEGK